MAMRTGKRLAALAFGLALGAGAVQADEFRQGWGPEERLALYYSSQGSRLMPKTWFDALEREDGTPFTDLDHLTSYGLLAAEDSPTGYPIGMPVDRQSDKDLSFSRLRWYKGQKDGETTAEPWVGLNCFACHTGAYELDGELHIVDGAPSMFDYQSFMEAFDAAMEGTLADEARWGRFSGKVLGTKLNDDNDKMLKDAFTELLAWEKKTYAMNETDLRYGYARVDAVGHILNRVLMFAGAGEADGNSANAPVSYPFLWNIWKQKKVQWNGSVENLRVKIGLDELEYGALGRNTGEVIGVFGDLILKEKSFFGGLRGYTSSVNALNLNSIELLLQKLEPPAWPEAFPALDEEKVRAGQLLFRQNCASCHLTPDMQVAGQPTERMIPFINTPKAELTDIWMACNAYVYQGPTGPLKGTKDLDGNTLGATAPVFNMLGTAVRGALVGAKGDLVKAAADSFFGIRRLPEVNAAPSQFDPRAGERNVCLTTTDVPILAYKARPLDGIWATAPYLHNGSVANLYELLLPAEDRMKSFNVGNRTYDPVKGGYSTDPAPNGQSSLFTARDENGKIVEGNGNQGHQYGAAGFTDEERWAIVEYLKSL